jgi:catechol 2,3-dioxygenase-like lactoylglutathione lyase family enzyme
VRAQTRHFQEIDEDGTAYCRVELWNNVQIIPEALPASIYFRDPDGSLLEFIVYG